MVPEYLHLPPESTPPAIPHLPFRAVVVVDEQVTDGWRALVSEWLVAIGCLYMMAWGDECSLWNDSVDCANIDAFDNGDIPEDRFVMTTWHDDQPLTEAFWFAEHCAQHPIVEFDATLILDITSKARGAEVIALYTASIAHHVLEPGRLVS